jgi:hypothetical protein
MTRDEILAEWGDAAYNAQENYTMDPHEHIGRLIAVGDQLAVLAALASLVEEAEMDASKHARDAEPRYSRYQMDEATKPLHAEIERLRSERDEARALHQELMFQVGSKYPSESRHETAKRYLREHEDRCLNTTASKATAPVEIHHVHGTAETVIGSGPHDGSAWAVPAPSDKE